MRVNEGVKRVYQYIVHTPGIRLPDLSSKLHVSGKTLERWIKRLCEEKKIVFKGAAKIGGYYVIDGDI